jgi:NADH-quinone oxidoreductase subunit L
MLNLVLADNMLVLFLGWEGVGLCSFLLIGFDSHKKSANAASRMAFIVNRIGDAGFIIGIFLLMMYTGSLQFDQLNKSLATKILQPSTLDLIAFFLLLGALAKSAQIPLYIWLPSAMAGPTPVSALIHAATMVTAGIFMIARLSSLFSGAIQVSVVMAYIGAATALLGALIALTQTDIKKILAYSTVSQLGFMFLAMGTGAYHAGMFHLLTHAFFKALLFLGAGAVILVMHHEQDVRKMGGLIKDHKLLALLFWCGGLALAGFPGFSGFFSKDMILENAYKFRFGGEILYAAGVFTAMLTAFYTLRMILLVFYGQSRSGHHSPVTLGLNIRFPLIVLAVLSVVGGYVGLPGLFTGSVPPVEVFFAKSLSADLKSAFEAYRYPVTHAEEYVLMLLSVLLVGAGLVFAYFRYRDGKNVPIADGAYRTAPVRFSYQAFHVDNVLRGIIVNPIKKAGKLHEVYPQYDLFLTASTMETQGLVILESIACGLPAVGVKSFAIPELIKDDKNGYCAEPFNAIEIADRCIEILTDAEKYKRFSENSIKIASEHELNGCVLKMEDVYERAIILHKDKEKKDHLLNLFM